MVIAMVAVWMMKVPIHQVVGMVAMRDLFMTAVRAMDVIRRVPAAVVLGRAIRRVSRRNV